MQGLNAAPLGFLRLVGVVLFWLLSILAGTERAKARRWSQQSLTYGGQVILLLQPLPCSRAPSQCLDACTICASTGLLVQHLELSVKSQPGAWLIWCSVTTSVKSQVA